MDAQGLEIFGQLAGVAWLLFFIITLLLGILAVLLPFFVWRIWKWSHATCQEVVKLNGKIERLVTLLERGTVAASLLQPPPRPTETFTFAPATEETSGAPAEKSFEPAPDTEQAVTFEEEPFDLEPFPAEEPLDLEPLPTEEEEAPGEVPSPTATKGEEPAEEPFEPAPASPSEEEPFDLEPAQAAEPFEPEPFPTAAKEAPPTITPLPGDPGKPGTSFARCEACGHKLAYKATLAGKRIRCPSCKTIHTLP